MRGVRSLALIWLVSLAAVGTAPASSNLDAPRDGQNALRDGQHDFDFDLGKWKTHSSRLLHPLTGSTEWVDMDGATVVKKIWGYTSARTTIRSPRRVQPRQPGRIQSQ